MTIDESNEMNGRGKSRRSLPILPGDPSPASTNESRQQTYWRSLDELNDTPEFQEWLQREFPENASEWRDPKGRRQFLKLMGASLALAGLTACTRQPAEKIVPYVRQPEELLPGEPLFFATAATLSGFATGILVESHEGRPTKIEGNPEHPASAGSVDPISLASILDLYDPDRPRTVTRVGNISTWSAFAAAINVALDGQRTKAGAGLRILTETVTSPTLAAQLDALLKQFPSAKWHQYEPAGRDNVRAGAKLIFGEYVDTVYRFEKADVILSLGSDFLVSGPGSLRYARDFSSRRRIDDRNVAMNRLYVVESTPSNTGASADHRLPVGPGEIERIARAILSGLGGPISAGYEKHGDWIAAVVSDLNRHRGAGVVIPGEHEPPEVHALAHEINRRLGNAGNTVVHIDPVEANPTDQLASLKDLVREMDAGTVEVLVIVGGNPVYTAPADLNFADSIAKVPLRAHLGPYYDETSELCHWHVPEAHYLESWSDARAYDGTTTIIQPLIAPLYHAKSSHELIAALMNQPERPGYDIVRESWKGKRTAGSLAASPQTSTATSTSAAASTGGAASAPVGEAAARQSPKPDAGADFETWWRRSLHDGVIAGSAAPPRQGGSGSKGNQTANLRPDQNAATPSQQSMPSSLTGLTGLTGAQAQPSASREPNKIDLVFRPDPTIFDGRFSNNGWLQELPKPLSKLTWDNAALIGPATASRLGLANEDVVEIDHAGRSIKAPIWILPGHVDDCVTLHLGYGRTRSGRVGTAAGFNAYAIRTSDSPWLVSGARLTRTSDRASLACTQLHHNLEGRDILRSGTLQQFREDPTLAPAGSHEGEHASLYPKYDYPGYAWGMAIDLNACIGCNACVVACQSENNIPVVGREQVARGREMHWIRVDRYYKGTPEQPEAFFQPLPCMQCENAPCEVVCPVAATAHSAEGLNDMVYNRCVGTRYCANNCPYKVRRFNFLLFQDWESPSLKMMRNPDVTVRSRGVMEKCTYCVQRINRAKIDAEKEDRAVRDGEIVTACEAACPTDAIVFGNINDPKSRVSALKADHRNYSLLSELNTYPRTTYLGAIRNPNPELKA